MSEQEKIISYDYYCLPDSKFLNIYFVHTEHIYNKLE